MKAPLFALVLVLAAGSAAAQWLPVKGAAGVMPGYTYYYSAMLNASNEEAASKGLTITGNGSADAMATFELWVPLMMADGMGTTASWKLNISMIKELTMAHIHIGNATSSGAPVVIILPQNATSTSGLPMESPPLNITMPTVFTGTFNASDFLLAPMTTLTAANATFNNFLLTANAGDLYINLHNKAYPAGVIRGQLMSMNITAMGPSSAPMAAPMASGMASGMAKSPAASAYASSTSGAVMKSTPLAAMAAAGLAALALLA